MSLRPLGHTELITLESKDEQYYKVFLGDPIQEITQRVLGVRRWLQFRDALTFLSRLGYFGQTSLNNISTLGEEFCEAQNSNAVTPMRKFLLVLLNSYVAHPKQIPKPISHLIDQLHMVTFGLFADHFSLSKRVVGMLYSTDTIFAPPSKKINYIFKAIGCISLIRLVAGLANGNYELSKTDSHTLERGSELFEKTQLPARDTGMLCPLCNETRSEPTATECGHIFCWNCIHRWLRGKEECPICRKITEPSRLIHLVNFR